MVLSCGAFSFIAARIVELMGRPGFFRARIPERTTIAIVMRKAPRRPRKKKLRTGAESLGIEAGISPGITRRIREMANPLVPAEAR